MYNATHSSPVSHDPLPGMKMRKSLHFFPLEWICTVFSSLLGQECKVNGVAPLSRRRLVPHVPIKVKARINVSTTYLFGKEFPPPSA